jgi:Tfp pilus assembly protein PilN
MSDLDLIPLDYRRSRRAGTWWRWGALAYAVVTLSLGGSWLEIERRADEKARGLAKLEEGQRVAAQQQARIDVLTRERRSLEQRILALSRLRGGVAAVDMFETLDRALDSGVWFLDWRFRRAGEWADAPPEAVERGYFIVVPAGEGGEKESRAWRMETHMELTAQARDHSALAGFVRRLGEQEEIESVRVLNTEVRSVSASEVVDFELAIVVQGRA